MTRLQKSSRFLEGSAPSYLRTHPVTFERIAEAQSRAESTPYKQVADSLDFHLVRALLRSYQGEPGDAVRYFEVALAERALPARSRRATDSSRRSYERRITRARSPSSTASRSPRRRIR